MPTPALSLFPVRGIPLLEAGCDLAALLIEHLDGNGLAPQTGDILAVAQKIVSKAEDRYVLLRDVEPTPAAKLLAYGAEKDPRIAELVLRESTRIVRDTPDVIIAEHRLGLVLANAGIDRSNVGGGDETVLLLPENPDASARALKRRLDEHYGVRIGVIVTDSVGRPWRLGTTGIAIGSAGVVALHDMRGRLDLFGRVQQVAEVATADCVAGIAALLMGESDESVPVVLVRGLDAGESEQTAGTIIRPAEENLFP